jgi:hypothetical protein
MDEKEFQALSLDASASHALVDRLIDAIPHKDEKYYRTYLSLLRLVTEDESVHAMHKECVDIERKRCPSDLKVEWDDTARHPNQFLFVKLTAVARLGKHGRSGYTRKTFNGVVAKSYIDDDPLQAKMQSFWDAAEEKNESAMIQLEVICWYHGLYSRDTTQPITLPVDWEFNPDELGLCDESGQMLPCEAPSRRTTAHLLGDMPVRLSILTGPCTVWFPSESAAAHLELQYYQVINGIYDAITDKMIKKIPQTYIDSFVALGVISRTDDPLSYKLTQ